MNDDSRWAELMNQADEYVRQLEALGSEFRNLGDVEVFVSLDELRDELGSFESHHPVPFGALRI